MLKIIVPLFFIIVSLHAIEKVSLVLAWKHQFQFAGYYMAKEKGFYKDAGLFVDIKEFDLKRDNARDVAFRKYDFGIKHSEIILDILDNYKNLKLLAAIYQSSPLVLISKKRDDIKTLKDIKNKTIMISSDDFNNASILAMLSSEKIKKRPYKIINTSFNINDLMDDIIDMQAVYISSEPFNLIEKKIPYTVFNPRDYGYNFYSDILFTSEDLIVTKPKVVKAFYEASMKGWKYAFSHIDETINIILKSYNTQNKTKDALLYEAKTLKKFAFEKDIPFGNINPEKLKELVNTYRLLNVTYNNTKLDYNDLIFKDSRIQNNKEKLINTLVAFYHNHQTYIYIFIVIFAFINLLTFSIIRTMKLLLNRQRKELTRHYEIFDKNIASSRTDLGGNITHVTEALCKTTGYTKEELIGQNHRIFKDPNDTTTTDYHDFWHTITSGHTWSGEFHNINKDGSPYWSNSIISPIFDEDSSIIGYEGIRENVTIKKVLQEFNKKLKDEVTKQTNELQKSELYLNTLFNINPNITYVIKNDTLERVNKAFLDFTDFSSLTKFLNTHKCICELFEESDKKHHYIDQKESDSHCSIDTKVTIRKNSKSYIFKLTTQNFTIQEEERSLVILEDITALEEISITDKLTGLYNRVKIDSEIDINYNYYKEFDENFSLILIDIDFFKNVNDSYGHLVGDEVLKSMAQFAKNSIRSTDILARWGGEEFMVICPNTEKKNAYEIAHNIQKNIETQKFPRDLKITISAGISDMLSNSNINTLIESTDKALYLAKENGRNRVEIN